MPLIFFLLKLKKMDAKAELKDIKKLMLTEIKETPFSYATNGEMNYIVCGKVLLETEKNEQEIKDWLDNKPWDAIALMTQAICNEMINENKNK